jgi:hypothetical protein
MIEVEGKNANQSIAILIDSRESHSYNPPNWVEIFHLKIIEHEKSCFFQLATRTKRKNNDIVKGHPLYMNGFRSIGDINIIPLRSYDFLIGMDRLDVHHAFIDFHNTNFTYIDEEGNQRIFKGILRPIYIRDISNLKRKMRFRKGCKLYVDHVEEPTKLKIPSLEDFTLLQEFTNVFEEILGLPPKGYIGFSIDLIPIFASISKTPDRMGTLELKELKMLLEELLNKGYICPSVSPWGSPILFLKNKYGTLRLCIYFR